MKVQPTLQEKEALIGLFRAGRHAEACSAARAMCRRYPRSLDAWNIRGASARALDQLHEAEKSFRELEKLAPTFAGAPYNLGLVLENKGAHAEAVQAYSRAVTLDPDLAQAHNNLGAVHLRLGELEAAYRHLKRACQLQPAWPQVHNSFGNALKRLNRIDDARAAYQRAIEAKADFTKAHYNLGVLESEAGNRAAAIEALRAVLALDPDHALARAMALHEFSQLCDWDAMAEHAAYIPKLGVETSVVPPFLMLALEDDPAHQLARSRKWATARYGHPQEPRRTIPRPKVRPDVLRVGFLGADFHDHPGMRLMTGMLAEIDRSRFEVHAISYGRLRDDEWRARSEASVDEFHDVFGHSDAEVDVLLKALKLDIAIDRQGYTIDTRSDWFARRFAPVQISYLGFCSTMAAPFIDYMVADPKIIPARHRAHYAESVIWLPDCYQPGIGGVTIAPDAGSRADHGLPEDALVLCCFNNLYKLTPHVFAIWMRVLRKIDEAVLWLYASNETAKANVHRAASAAGVDPARVVFAPRIPNAQHLARHAHADLSLDTAPYNAHTTCNDALWAGLPVVTRIGEQVSARVAASLLNAVGLPELVTSTDEDYEGLILDLARDPERLSALRAKLALARTTAPLFDTARYTRHFEAGFDAAYERFLKGQSPADIVVEPYTGQNG